ncbi:uncharacterized protein NECHADRAFT_75175 [Fusarium vanettenii 77-13-4]|uniref:Uncharacterized protein n=1 Tax=Fusarium vanettenii (strain ATCC MYA-4622 / CBS 123669 / FGSC 9596 / NRRL 45880 / 77-13-4) TaxID=660122 RepID=C7YI29_FUSV7|nr:uncharacterized protein NECHADRAFT_75175 [Fusarium vanettenii 77-13-4]EEU48021.1 predicted protein [Fusarium vanettenii 77-13-4]
MAPITNVLAFGKDFILFQHVPEDQEYTIKDMGTEYPTYGEPEDVETVNQAILVAYRGDSIVDEEGDELHAELAGPKELTIYHEENLRDGFIRHNLARPTEAVRVMARAGRLFLPKNKREAPAMKNRLVLQAPTGTDLLKGVYIGISGISLQPAFAAGVISPHVQLRFCCRLLPRIILLCFHDGLGGVRGNGLHDSHSGSCLTGTSQLRKPNQTALTSSGLVKAIEDAAAINENVETAALEANGFALPEGDFTLPVYRLPTEGTGDEAARTNADEGIADTNAWPGDTNLDAQDLAWPVEESGNNTQLHVWAGGNGSETAIETWTVAGTEAGVISANLHTSITPAQPTMAQASFLEQENDHTPVSGNRFEYPTAAETSNGFVVPSGLLDNGDASGTIETSVRWRTVSSRRRKFNLHVHWLWQNPDYLLVRAGQLKATGGIVDQAVLRRSPGNPGIATGSGCLSVVAIV